MRTKALLGALALTVATVPVHAETKSDYDKEYDFAKLKRFDFKHQTPGAVRDAHGPNDLWNRRIHDDLAGDLQANGFERTTSRSPDFLVAYYMGARQREDIRYLGHGFPGWS